MPYNLSWEGLIMPSRKSIGIILSHAPQYKRAEIAQEWAKQWIGESNKEFKQVEMYLREGQIDTGLRYLHKLYEDTTKRLYALDNIFGKIRGNDDKFIDSSK